VVTTNPKKTSSWLTVLISAGLGLSVSPHQVLTRTDEVSRALSQVLSSYEVIRTAPGEIEQQIRTTGELRFRFDETDFYFNLEPHDMRAPGYRAVETGSGGVRRTLPPQPLHTFKGVLAGREDTRGRFNLTDGGVEGVVYAPEGWVYVEPLQNYLPGAPSGELVVYSHADIKPGEDIKCGVSLPKRLQRGVEQVTAQVEAATPTKYEFEVATEADYEYVQALGGSQEANREIEGILNQVDGVYQSELLLQLKVSFQHAWTMEDPYHKTNKNILLDDFGEHWNEYFATSQIYDVAHLWTGKSLEVYGTATRGAACRFPTLSYGLSARLTGIPEKYALTAHEIGHNFGATHPHAKNPPIAGCQGTIMRGSDYISGNGAVLTFCEFSRQQIAAHVAQYNDCLTPRPISLQPPSDLKATVVSTSGVDLSWRDRSTNETGFRVERRPGETNAWVQIGTAPADATTFSSRGLFPGDTYRFRVRAFNDSESSAYSNEAAATTLSGTLTRAYWTIHTIAGGGVGDNGPAVEAQLHSPGNLAMDGWGNLHVADTENHRIRRIDRSGTITTIAGTGEANYGGDGGPATEARLKYPAGVAVDGAGNLYIADRSNHRIRRVDRSGTISTMAGTGERGFGGDGGPAVAAQLNFPKAVAVDDSGNLYIADEWNNRIRRVDPSGTITTFAGIGRRGFSGDGGTAVAARLNHPNGVAVDDAGNLYIADSDNHRIRRIDSSGTITTIAGTGERGFSGDDGSAASAQLSYPTGMAIDSAGNLVFADTGNNRIRRVDSSGTITTLAGTGEVNFSGDEGSAVAAELNGPSGVAIDPAGNLVFADSGNHRIRRVDLTGTIATIAGVSRSGFRGDGGPAVAAELNHPEDVAIDGAGNFYIADTANHRIRRVDSSGTITTIAGTGENGFRGDGGPAVAAQLSEPKGVTVDGTGNLYIADTENHRIRRVDSSGTITTIAGTGENGFRGDGGPAVAAELNYPKDVAIDAARNLYIADTTNHRIRRIDPSGRITTIAGTGQQGFSGDWGPAISAQLSGPYGVSVNGSGHVYIADTWNLRIRRVDPDGTITTFAGTGEWGFSGDEGPAIQARLRRPDGVAVDASGNVYIADTYNQQIRRVDPAGTITTFAGSLRSGFSGDHGPAVQATFFWPRGVAGDGRGNVYVADTWNHRIRIVTLATPPTALEAPSGLTATAVSSSSVDLSWQDNSGNETGFRVQRRQGDSDDWAPVGATPTNTTTFSDTGLLADTRYRYRVQAFNDTESSAYSNQAAVTTSSLHPPGNVTATAVSSSGIHLSWRDNSINETGFRVQRQRDGSSHWVAAGTTPANATHFSDAGLLSGTRYRYRVQAFNRTESSAFSNPATATTLSVHPPGDLTARAVSNSRIDLRWQDNNPNETGFRVQRRQDGASLWLTVVTTAANATGFVDVGLLLPSTRYRYRVQAFNQTESSVFSNEATATTLSGSSAQDSWIIDTIAGGSVGDGGPAAAATVYAPSDVALDGDGNLYIADTENNRIRRVDPTGIITTIAGTGERGYSGDGGPAVAAQLSLPSVVALDGDGNLYIADTENNRIRRVDSSGIITTIAGTGEDGFSGDGGPAVASLLNRPSGVAVDGNGNLYIADTENQRIRRVDAAGKITTISGTGEEGNSGDNGPAVGARLDYPNGLAIDIAGDLYIVDSGNHRIRRVDSSGMITTIAGTGEGGYSGDGGPAVTAQLLFPTGIVADGAGNLYVADTNNQRIRRINSSGTITTLAGTGEQVFGGEGGPAVEAQLAYPRGVAVDGSGHVYIADSGNSRVRRIDSSGMITTVAGTGEGGYSGDGGPAGTAQLNSPSGVAVDGSGNVYIADTQNHRIRRVDATGMIVTIAGTGESGYSGDGGPAVAARLNAPSGVAVDGSGNLYIADTVNERIRRVDSSGTITTIAGTGMGYSGDGGPAVYAQLSAPAGVAVDGSGNLYIADYFNRRIRRVDAFGIITTIAGTGERGFSGDGGPAIEAQVSNPTGVAMDGAGNLYIADRGNGRVRRVDTGGIITTIAGGGSGGDGGPAVEARLNGPEGVAVDSAGNVYIALYRIRRADPLGTITTVAGVGWGFSGDGGPAVQARLRSSGGVAVDGLGNVYIADSGNHRIRVVKRASMSTTLPPPTNLMATEVSRSRVNLAWQDNSTNETGFRVQRRLSGMGHWIVVGTTAANAIAFSDVGLLPGTTYHYRVQSFNHTSSSFFSNSIAAVTPAPAPTVTDFAPTMGPVGTRVTLTGTHLLGATAVEFNQLPAARFEVVSGTTIKAVVPLEATSGPISVVTPGGTAVSAESFTVAHSGIGSRLFVPIVLRAQGRTPGSVFTSELTLTNRGTTTAAIAYTYTAAFGWGSGTAVDSLEPGRQRIIGDAIAYLTALGLPIGRGSAGGTLAVDFSNLSSPSDAAVTVRVATPVEEGGGRAGLAFPGLNPDGLLTGPAFITGLRQNRQDRSNVAVQNADAGGEEDLTLTVTVYSGDPDAPGSLVLPDLSLPPGGFHQYNGVLTEAGFDNGYVKVERVDGTAPYYSYGVINDNFNSDGSFVFPVRVASLVGKMGQTLPVAIETRDFASELTVTNFSPAPKTVDFRFVAEAVETDDDTAAFSLELEAGEQRILPGIVNWLRQEEVAGIGAADEAFVGAVLATVAEGDMSGIVMGARTGSPDGRGGQYGLFYNGVPNGTASTTSAWIHGLQQNEENRSNLALVNTGEVDDSDTTFEIDIYDGEGDSEPRTRSVRLGPRRWRQINGILGGRRQGYVEVRKGSGNNPFIVYGVINDGAKRGQRSGDGAFILSQP